jgi:hypothetical protein
MRVYRPSRHLSSPLLGSQFAVLIFFLMQIMGIKGYGQTVDSNFVDGQVYIRIKGPVNQIPPYEIGDSLNNYPIPIQTIIGNYQVERIKKAFNLRSDTTVDYIYKVIFSDIANIGNLLNDFSALQFVDFAERVPLYKVNCTNEAMGYWNVGNPVNYHLNLINACNAFPLLVIGNQPVRVAVVDNEFDVNHPDLVNKFNPALCWDVSDNDPNVGGPPSYNHGTHCAGIVAAENNNNLGVSSLGGGWGTINPIEVMGIKVTPSSLPTGNSVVDGYAGIDWAATNGARIISCSWGTQTTSTNSVMAQAEQLALNQTLNNHPNIVVVFAAGNSNTINNAFPAAANAMTAPSIAQANLDRMLSVASVDPLSAKSHFSNFGPTIDICAPGTNIYSPIHDGNYQFSSGTSMATPMVASLLALVAYNNPAFTAQQIIDCVINSASNIDNMNPSYVGQLGAGLINAPGALTCAPSNNITFALNDNTFCANMAQNITVTIGGLPLGVTVSSIQWNLPGSNLGTATGATLNSLSYAQFGIFPVTLICMLSNANTVIFQTSFLCLGDMQLVPTSTMPICANSMQQISVVDAASLFVYSSFVANPVFNPVPLNLTNNFNGTHQSYFQITGNQTVSLPQVTYIFQNNSFNQTCLLNDNEVQYNPMCCELNMVQNSDFSLGNTLFTTNSIFHTNCNGPGTYTIKPTNTQPIGFSGGDILYYDAPYDYTNFITIPPSNCVPLTQMSFAPPAPVDVRVHTQLGLTSAAWQQTFMMTNSHDYKFSFLSKHGHSNLIFPFRVRVRITNGTNTVFTSPILTQFQATNQWTLNDILIQNFSGATGIYDIVVEQIDNYGDQGFDLDLDDLTLQVIYPLTITSSNTNLCLTPGTTNVLTASIPSSGITSYFWTGPNGGIIGSNTGQSVTVGLPGVYTLNAINASPLAINCANLSSTFVVNGTAITAAVNYSNCLGTITTNIISTTGNAFTYALNGSTPQTSNIFAGLPAGTYTVLATDDNGCTGSVTVTLNPYSSISASASPAAICIGSSSLLTASGAISYIWQPGNLSGSSVNVSPTATTTYTVTGTNSFSCTSTSTIAITVSNMNGLVCCNPNSTLPVSHIFPPNTTATQVLAWYNSGNALPATNTTIDLTNNPVGSVNQLYFDGNLDVNTNIRFLNCANLFFSKDAEINVGPFTLTIEKSNLSSPCSDMWNGILLLSNSSIVKVINTSEVHDMKLGIRVSAVGKLESIGTLFQNNNISVQLSDLPANYSGYIYNSTFKSVGLLKAPFANQSRGTHGIILANCASIAIGNPSNATMRNHFENLYNGILIRKSNSTTVPTNTIITSFNTFKNIYGGATLWPSPANTLPVSDDFMGCAIFGVNGAVTQNVNFTHFGNNNPAVVDFDNCQKAIICNSFTTDIENNRAISTDAGFLNYKCENNTQKILNNTIQNTYLGIGVYGNSNGGGASGNQISVLAFPILNNAGSSIFWGKGINIEPYSNTQNSAYAANDNIISSDAADWVIGININNSSYGPRQFNQITFTSNATNQVAYNYPTLRGIALSNSTQNRFEGNTVVGTYYNNTNTSRRSAGMYISRSPRNEFECNSFDKLRHGMQVVSDCNLYANTNFRGNLFNPSFSASPRHEIGILFRHLGSEGTFGDIGDLNNDNNNTFGPLSAYAGNFKVYKLCNLPTNDNIYTNPNVLNNNESGSNNNCKYQVNPNILVHNEYDCEAKAFIKVNGFDAFTAFAIAQDSMLYSEFEQVAEWMDENELYAQLRMDTALLNSASILQQFYTDQYADATRYIVETDELISALVDSLTGLSATEYNNLLSQAELRNNDIVSAVQHEINERIINTIYFKYLRLGVEGLSSSEVESIESLAYQCPFVGGTAVYKARTLYNNYNPGAYYDDIEICNAVGVYKGGKSIFDLENDLLKQGLSSDHSDNSMLEIYPNPTSSSIRIKNLFSTFEQSAFILYDMTGRVVMKHQIPNGIFTFELDLGMLANGVYQLQIRTANTLQTRKIILEH